MVTLKQIEEFIASEPIAMVGVSRNPRKFGFTAFRELKEKGMNIIPVNPHAKEIHQTRVYNDIKSLPADVKGLLIMTQKSQTAEIVRQAKEIGLKQIWIQQSSESKEAVEILKGSDINYITGQCILMYYKPHSIHKFHAGLKKFFGRYPK
ncbi:MAG TPA: CoA-binding protein [Bacteroidales bacterium]|jgi:predicted CoA-binding protein|nr:CoA-binding protein [Bacteroidales bacterium]OQB64608.1 MAG: CoA binding domain protein [Bacteroidetes bacterium ADurb.Bin145]HOU00937.1 CoA-binding protein [Bacteroidales bacterium]HQK66672.1 CoA-binding protein [Bacteroidales bacterium]